MAAVQAADLLVPPPIEVHIVGRRDRRLGRRAKGHEVMRAPVTEAGRTAVDVTVRSRDLIDHITEETLTGGSRKAVHHAEISNRDRSARVRPSGCQFRRSGTATTGCSAIRPMRRRARSGCMVIMRLPPR
jgi:hypothetical protein